jgi:hypothetical protein
VPDFCFIVPLASLAPLASEEWPDVGCREYNQYLIIAQTDPNLTLERAREYRLELEDQMEQIEAKRDAYHQCVARQG